MTEEDMVSGEGWISDESSFYGGDGKQGYQQLCKNNLIVSDWIHNKADLNVLLAKQRAAEAPAARQGKAKGVEPRGCLSFDPRECSLDSWQLGESVEDFVNRLPPLTTTTLTCPWIWVHNPWQDAHCHTAAVRVEEFTNRGRLLLDRSLHNRRNIQECGPKAFIAKSLIQEGKALQHKITELAVECGVVSGKWMLFPNPEQVSKTWEQVVEGVINNRLGPTAKVSAGDGNPNDRLVCIYTKDFRDGDDIRRVLFELKVMGFMSSGRTIYYKTDAFTYLNLYKQTASEYGLQASLYNSFMMNVA